MGLYFYEEAEPTDGDLDVLKYFLFSFSADFGEAIQDLIIDENWTLELRKRRLLIPPWEYRNVVFLCHFVTK